MSGRRPRRVLLLTLEWLALTVAYGSVIAHAATALDGYVTPRLDSGFIFAAALVFAGLFGLTVEPPGALIAMTVGLCLGGPLLLAGVLYAPVWLGYATGTVALQNYVTQQVLLTLLWSVIPGTAGALVGAMLAPAPRRAQPDAAQADDATRPPWWEARRGG